MERLDRGLIAINRPGEGVYLGWRLFGTDPSSISFHINRNGQQITSNPVTNSTNYMDSDGSVEDIYTILPFIDGVQQQISKEASVWSNAYLDLPLNRPPAGSFHGSSYTYEPNDCSTADLDGDGEYEIIVKWYPSNAKDNSQSGYTGPTLLDAYKLDGTQLWRINLGQNIRSGAHYTQFIVYDFEGDGMAELACKTAPGTIDGEGNYVLLNNDDPNADYTNSGGYVLAGPEYLTVFDGLTGAERSTVPYVPARGNVSSWGDNYGNRVDRFLAGVGYLDGVHPSLIMCRGYYTRTVCAAWDFVNGNLVERWVFDTNNGYGHYAGKGNHQVSIADVDNDGKDELIYGAIVIDDDGSGHHASTWGHGDALHVSDFDLDNPGQEIFMPVEYASSNPSDQRPSVVMRDANTGQVLWQKFANGDFGRGVCANIDPNHPGAESWASGGHGLYDSKGNQIGNIPSGINFTIWWDDDLTRELLDGTKLDKWNPAANNGNGGNNRIFTIYHQDVSEINGSKANPNLQADLFGDWREELVYRRNSNDALRIFTSTYLTNHRLYTLMHDPQYRCAVAWQNVGYNQPPHPSFYIGEDMGNPPSPNIVLLPDDGSPVTDCYGVINGTAYQDQCNTCVGGSTNRYPCVQIDNGYYKLHPAHSNMCVNGSVVVTQETCNDHFSQVWYIENVTGGFTLYNLENEVYLNAGTGLQGDQLSLGETPTVFRLEGVDGWVHLVDINNLDLVADVSGNSSAPGESILWWTRNGQENQRFTLESVEIVMDCNGTIDGTAYIDNCGRCVGGNTANQPCTKLEAESACDYDGVIESEHIGFSGIGYVNGINQSNSSVIWTINASIAGPYELSFQYANGASDSRSASILINESTQDILDFNPGTQWGDWISESVIVNLDQGLNVFELVSSTPDGLPNLDYWYWESQNLTSGTCTSDCNGDLGGAASIDQCGVCSGGATGVDPNSTCTDCNGQINGSASIDQCGVCSGGATGVDPNSTCTDCNGQINGSASIDQCGVCSGGTTGVDPNSTCTDCNGQINGSASIDQCGVCSGGTTGVDPNSTCTDCNGQINGSASIDQCGVCSGGNTGIPVDDCLTTINQISNDVSIFIHPNPTEGLLYLSKKTHWVLYTVSGCNLKEGNGEQVNLTEFPSGLYLLKFEGMVFRVEKL